MLTRYRAWMAIKLAVAALAASLLLALLYSVGLMFSQLRHSVDGILLACFFLLPAVAAMLWRSVVRDQRHRCRVCGKRLRMPLTRGTFAALLLDTPETEYVCPFGCGKLSEELSITGPDSTKWTRYGDIWHELFR